jgi:hypothetical protein
MPRYMTVVIALAVLLIACSDSTDISDSPDYVTIEVTPTEESGRGTFTATGSAICDSGVSTNVDWFVDETDWRSSDEFRCKDGSGTFVLQGSLPPPTDEPATLDGTWATVVGDGDYGTIQGSGTMTAHPPGLTETLPGPVGFVADRGPVTYVGELKVTDS